MSLSVTNVNSIHCFNSAGNISTSSESIAQCPSPYSITSCNVKTNGSVINMGASIIDNACYSLDTMSPSTTNAYIQTFARCCDFSAYPFTINYYESNESTASQSCELTETLIGCTAYLDIDIDDDMNSSTAITDGSDPYCSNGVAGGYGGEWLCCKASCGICTDDGCASRPGGESKCCPTRITSGGEYNDCDVSTAPCVISRQMLPYFATRTCTPHIGPITALTPPSAAYSGAICSDTSEIECVSIWGDSSEISHDNTTSTAVCPEQWFMTSCVAFSVYSMIESYFIENDVCIVINGGNTKKPQSAVYALATCCTIKPTQFSEDISMSRFHASASIFDYDKSVLYCEDICGSNLASIHSEEEMLYAQHIAYNSPQFHNQQYRYDRITSHVSSNVRIGLIKSETANEFHWTDGSVFDYGFANLTFNYAKGHFPWSWDSKPDTLNISDSKICVNMHSASDYRWVGSNDCGQRTRTLCNSCDGELIKYAAMTFKNGAFERDFDESKPYCKQYLGTNLASIHNQYDFDLARKLCEFNGKNCWVGLEKTSDGPTPFEWTDGTPFNFGTQLSVDDSIWVDDPLGTSYNCVQFDEKETYYGWDRERCSKDEAAVICAMPSLLCYTHYWTVDAQSGAYLWEDCRLYLDDGSTDNAAITNQQWINYNGKFVLEFVFRFESYEKGKELEATAGIMILYDAYDWYYIAMKPNTHQVEIWKRWKAQYYIVSSVPFHHNTTMYQTLHLTVLNRTRFTVTVNDEISFEYLDTSRVDDEYMILSGFIGIRSECTSIEARYLYTSGALYAVNNTNSVNNFRAKYTFSLPVYGMNITLEITSFDEKDRATIIDILEAYALEVTDITTHCEEDVNIVSFVNNNITTFLAVIGTCDELSLSKLLAYENKIALETAITEANITEVVVTVTIIEPQSELESDDNDDVDAMMFDMNIIWWISIAFGICIIVLFILSLYCSKMKKKKQRADQKEQNLEQAVSDEEDQSVRNESQLQMISNEPGVITAPTATVVDCIPGEVVGEEKEATQTSDDDELNEDMYGADYIAETTGATAGDTAGATATATADATQTVGEIDSAEGVCGDLSDYKMIKRSWSECAVHDWQQYFDRFVEHQVSDAILLDLSKDDENWNVLIPKVGPKMQFQKVWFKIINQ